VHLRRPLACANAAPQWRETAIVRVGILAREQQMVIRSDLSGDVIPDAEAVIVTIRFADPERNTVKLDVAESEVEDLIRNGRVVKPRTRRSRTRSAADDS
jgi:hypothetical protein